MKKDRKNRTGDTNFHKVKSVRQEYRTPFNRQSAALFPTVNRIESKQLTVIVPDILSVLWQALHIFMHGLCYDLAVGNSFNNSTCTVYNVTGSKDPRS